MLEVGPGMTAFKLATQSQQLHLRLNRDKQFSTAYRQKERFTGKLDTNWMDHRCSFLTHCHSYEVPKHYMVIMVRIALVAIALTLFDDHLTIYAVDRQKIDVLFTNCFDWSMKQEEV